MPSDTLLDDDAVALDLQRLERDTRLAGEPLRRLGPLAVLLRLLRRRTGELLADVGRPLGDGGDDQRQPARCREGGDVRALGLAFAVQTGVVERLVDLRVPHLTSRSLDAGRQ